MEYNNKDIDMVVKYKNSNMSDKTILALINKQSNIVYTETDIQKMYEQGTAPDESSIENSKLFDIAASIVFNPRKRRAIKIGLILTALVFVAGLLLLGVFVSWKPVIITVASLVGVILIVAVTIFVLIKSGGIERYLEKHDM